MKKISTLALATVLTLGFGGSAFAGSYTCESGPKEEWKSEDEARAMVEEEGYEIRKVKEEGGCYEVYAKKDGEKFELFINPKTLEIVKIEED